MSYMTFLLERLGERNRSLARVQAAWAYHPLGDGGVSAVSVTREMEDEEEVCTCAESCPVCRKGKYCKCYDYGFEQGKEAQR